MTPQSAPPSASPAGPAGQTLQMAGPVEVGVAGAGPVRQTPDSKHSSSYVGHETEPTAVLGSPPPAVIMLLTVFVAAVFVVRLGRAFTRKTLPAQEAAERRQQAGTEVDMGRDG